MTLEQLKKEIEVELNLTLQELEEKSTKDLKNCIKELKRNLKYSKVLMIKNKNSKSIPPHIELHKANVEIQIDNIEEVLEAREDYSKKTDKKQAKINFTLNQKYQIIKQMGCIALMVEKFDETLQRQIFSELFDCHEDTARKVFSGTYKRTKDSRPMDYKEILNKINK